MELENMELEKRRRDLLETYKCVEKDYNQAYKSDCLSEVDNSRIWSLHKIVERKANQIVLMKRFLLDLEYVKGEN